MKYFLIVFLLVSFNVFADQQIFYDKVRNHQIVDLSGTQTLEYIKATSGDANYEVMTIKDDEAVRIKNGKLEKYNYKEESAAKKAIKDAERLVKKNALKTKLGLTDEEIEFLIR